MELNFPLTPFTLTLSNWYMGMAQDLPAYNVNVISLAVPRAASPNSLSSDACVFKFMAPPYVQSNRCSNHSFSSLICNFLFTFPNRVSIYGKLCN